MTLGLPSVSNAASDQLSVSSLPPEFVIGEPNAKQEKLTLEVFITSQAPQRLVVEFIDFFSGEDGATTQLRPGNGAKTPA